MPRRERLDVVASEAVGPYTLLRLERGGLDPGAPGQFFMLEAPGRLLPRALSLCFAPTGELAFLVDAVGPGTAALCELAPGERMHVFGPLGHGFRLDVTRPLLVGGGIGIAPLPYLAEALRFPPVVLGFRSERHAEAAVLLPGAAHRRDGARDAERDRAGKPGARAVLRGAPAATARARRAALDLGRRLLRRGLRGNLRRARRRRGRRAQSLVPECRRGTRVRL